MRATALALFAASFVGPAFSQFNNETAVQNLVNTLKNLGLTDLTRAIANITNTPAGQSLLNTLTNGQSYTLLAPNNQAWSGLNIQFANDPKWIGQALAYHVIPGVVDLAEVRNLPNTTVFSTLLNDSSLVWLGGKGQNIAFTKIRGTTHIDNQIDHASVILNTTRYENLVVHTIDAVVNLPPATDYLFTLSSQGHSQNLTNLTAFAPAELKSNLQYWPAVTIFAPTDAAFQRAFAKGTISPATINSTITPLLLNHIINGTLVFSGHNQTNYTSGGNNEITVGTGGLEDGSGSVVYYRGQEVANILWGDIITQNGVVHLIDTVLPNTQISK